MKQPNLAALKRYPEPVPDLYQDETLAMVYVGDVYSLVALGDTVSEEAKPTIEELDVDQRRADEDNDALLPFVR